MQAAVANSRPKEEFLSAAVGLCLDCACSSEGNKPVFSAGKAWKFLAVHLTYSKSKGGFAPSSIDVLEDLFKGL